MSNFISHFIAVAFSSGGLYLSAGGWEQLGDHTIMYVTSLLAGIYFFGWYALCIDDYLHEYGARGISRADLYDYCKPMWIIIIAGAYWAGSCIWVVFA